MIRSIALLAVAFIGMAAAWTSNGYYDRYNVAPMRADQDTLGFGSLFEANRRTFSDNRMNTNGEYSQYRSGGMDHFPRYNQGYGSGYGYGGSRNYNDYDLGYSNQGYGNQGKMLTRYRPNNGYGYDYGYNGRYNNGYSNYNNGYSNYNNAYGNYGNHNQGYNNRYSNRGGYNRYNNGYSNDYWSNSQSPRGYGGYSPNYDSYRQY